MTSGIITLPEFDCCLPASVYSSALVAQLVASLPPGLGGPGSSPPAAAEFLSQLGGTQSKPGTVLVGEVELRDQSWQNGKVK